MKSRSIVPLMVMLAVGWVWAVEPGSPDNAGKPRGRLGLGAPAPQIVATTPDGKPMDLADLRSGDPPKIVVLQFASLTDPVFRARVPAVERLAQMFPDKVVFVALYQREAHASNSADALALNGDEGYNIAQPLTLEDRWRLARLAADRLGIKHQTMLVDAIDNTSAERYGSYPNMTFIIDDKGVLQAAYPWMDPSRVQGALTALLAGKPIPLEFQGSVKLSGAAPLDFTNAALDMTGGRNAAAAIANVLDKINLSDPQKQALYPALAEYLASLQNFRATVAAVPGRANATRPALPPNANPNAPKTATTQDAQNANAVLHAAADKLKGIVKQTLSAKDAAQLFDALEGSQAQHLFINP